MVEPNIQTLSLTVRLITGLWAYIVRLYKTVVNYATRPKISLSFKNVTLEFETANGLKHHIFYPGIIFSTEKDCVLNINAVRLNKESLSSIFGSDPNFLNLQPQSQNHHRILNCDLYEFTSKNWLNICQNMANYQVKKFDKIAVPLYLAKEKSNLIFSVRQDCRIFFQKRKLCLELEIDNKKYHYGLSLNQVCKVVISWLACRECV